MNVSPDLSDAELLGLKVIKPEVSEDVERIFMRTNKTTAFEKVKIDKAFAQDNYSKSKIKDLRELRYQEGDVALQRSEDGTVGNDPTLAIDWPTEESVLSDKMCTGHYLKTQSKKLAFRSCF